MPFPSFVSDSPSTMGDTQANEQQHWTLHYWFRVNTTHQRDFFLHSLCPSDINSPLQLLLAVILKVHQLGLPKHKPAAFPVAAWQGWHSSSFFVEPAWLEGLLLGAEPHEGLVLQDTPAPPPRVHETSCKREAAKLQQTHNRGHASTLSLPPGRNSCHFSSYIKKKRNQRRETKLCLITNIEKTEQN